MPWHPPCALLRLITLLRLRYKLSGSLIFLFFATGLLRLLSRLHYCAVVKVRGGFPRLQASFQNPENDTVNEATVSSLDNRPSPFALPLAFSLELRYTLFSFELSEFL